ncbi:MAG: hypothetical protein PVI30_18610 [Myxococcales bacterium]|jgi:hypothetical protein
MSDSRPHPVLSRWPRITEALLGAWLVFSPTAVLGVQDPPRVLHDACVGAAVAICSGLSMTRLARFRYAHVGSLLLGLWLVALAFVTAFSTEGASASALTQNRVMTGLTIAMLAIIPTRTLAPPRRWVRYYAARRER